MTGRRDFYRIPNGVEPISQFLDSLTRWYHTIQPDARRQAWVLQTHQFTPPSSLLPDDPSVWSELRKGGPSGFFILLLALSWSARLVVDPMDAALLEGILLDVMMVLEKMAGLTAAEDSSKIASGSSEKGDGKKRKSSEKENSRPTKRARK